MFSIKTLASTVAAAGLVSVIGLAYAQTDPRIESPANQGNTSMPNNNTGTEVTTTTPDNRTGTQGSTLSSDNNLRDNNLRADGSSDREPRADRN